nr:MAG: RNA-dependent RNA polymerase [brine shrimp endornavirus 2]
MSVLDVASNRIEHNCPYGQANVSIIKDEDDGMCFNYDTTPLIYDDDSGSDSSAADLEYYERLMELEPEKFNFDSRFTDDRETIFGDEQLSNTKLNSAVKEQPLYTSNYETMESQVNHNEYHSYYILEQQKYLTELQEELMIQDSNNSDEEFYEIIDEYGNVIALNDMNDEEVIEDPNYNARMECHNMQSTTFIVDAPINYTKSEEIQMSNFERKEQKNMEEMLTSSEDLRLETIIKYHLKKDYYNQPVSLYNKQLMLKEMMGQITKTDQIASDPKRTSNVETNLRKDNCEAEFNDRSLGRHKVHKLMRRSLKQFNKIENCKERSTIKPRQRVSLTKQDLNDLNKSLINKNEIIVVEAINNGFFNLHDRLSNNDNDWLDLNNITLIDIIKSRLLYSQNKLNKDIPTAWLPKCVGKSIINGDSFHNKEIPFFKLNLHGIEYHRKTSRMCPNREELLSLQDFDIEYRSGTNLMIKLESFIKDMGGFNNILINSMDENERPYYQKLTKSMWINNLKHRDTEITTDEPNTFIKCKYCNVINIQRGYCSEIENCKINTINSIEEMLDQWLCGYCFNNLLLEQMTAKPEFFINWKVSYVNNYWLAGELDALTEMGYGDFYDDLTLKDKEKIRRNDEGVTKRYLTHRLRVKCYISANLSLEDQANLNDIYPSVITSRCTSLISDCPLLISEVSAAATMIMNNALTRTFTIYGDITGAIPGHHKRSRIITPSGVRHVPEPGQIAMILPAGLDCDISKVLTLCRQQNQIYVILPRLDMKTKQLVDGTGIIHSGSELTHYFPTGSRQGIIYNSHALKCIMENDIIILGYEKYAVETVKQGCTVTIYSITGPHEFNELSMRRSSQVNYSQKIKLCLPNINGDFGGWDLFNYQVEFIDFNPSFFHYLCLRNLDGKLTHSGLRGLAVSFNNTRIMLNGHNVHHVKIEPEQIDIHVILCRLTMMTKYYSTVLNQRHQQFIDALGPFAAAYNLAQQKTMGLIVETALDWVSSTFHIDREQFDMLLNTIGKSQYVQDMIKLDIWDDLLKLVHSKDVENAKCINSLSLEEVPSQSYSNNCMHHTLICKHLIEVGDAYCKCCNYIVEDGDEYCRCCDTIPTLPEYTYPLVNRTESGTKLTKQQKSKLEIGTIDDANIADIMSGIKFSSSKEKPTPKLKPRPGPTKPIQTSTTQEVVAEIDNTKKSELDNETTATTTPVTTDADRLTWQYVSKSKLDRKVAMVIELASQDAIKAFKDGNPAIPALGISYIAHLNNRVKFEQELNQASEPGFYVKPHMPYGATIIEHKNYCISDEIALINSRKASCGYEAYAYVTNTDLTIDEFANYCDQNQDFSNYDLMKICEIDQKNLIILSTHGSHVLHYDITNDNYGVIAHAQLRDPTYAHWEPSRIKLIEEENNFLIADYIMENDVRFQIMDNLGFRANEITENLHMTNKDIMKIEYALYNLMQGEQSTIIQSWPRYIEEGDQSWLTNNETGVHDVRARSIHIPIPGDIKHCLRWLESDPTEVKNNSQFKEQYHIESGLPTVPRNEIVQQIRENCRNIIRARSHHLSNKLKQASSAYELCELIMFKSICKFKRSNFKMDIKVKAFDIVYVERDNKLTHYTVVKVDKEHIYINLNISVPIRATVYILKISTGSNLIQICNLANCQMTGQLLTAAFNRMNCTMGPGGMGKTTRIANTAKPDDLVVAFTTNAVHELSQRCSKGVHVMSIERANSSIFKFNNLFIDECTLVNYMDIITILERANGSISIFGSRSQVSRRDMTQTPGSRIVTNLTDFVPKDNMTVINYTYRIGEPAISHLKCIEPDLVGNENKRTEFEFHNTSLNNLGKIYELMCKTRIDAIITPYKSNKKAVIEYLNKIRSGMPNTTIHFPTVHTTHTIQGSEFPNVLILLRPEYGAWNLNGDMKYVNSSCFRGKDHIIVLVMGFTKQARSLSDVLNVRAGADYTQKIKSSAKSMHLLTDEDIRALNNKNIKRDGANLSFSREGNITKAVATMKGLPLATITNIDGEVTVNAVSNSIEKQIIANLDKEETVEVESGTFANVDFDLNAISKIRTLALLVNCVVSKPHELELPLDDENVIFTKGTGCPLYCSLYCVGNGWKLKIYSQAHQIYRRKVVLVGKPTMAALHLLQWLKLDVTLTKIPYQFTNTWLDKMQNYTDVTLHLTGERITQLWTLLTTAIFDAKTCDVINNRNKIWLKNLKLKHKLNNVDLEGWQSVIQHPIILVREWKLFSRTKTYKVYDKDGHIMSLNTQPQLLCLEIMELTMRLTETKLAGLKPKELDIQGLIYPVDLHLKKGTSSASLLQSRYMKERIDEAESNKDTLWITEFTKRKFRYFLRTNYPKMLYNATTVCTSLCPFEDLMENLMISSCGRNHKEEILYYGGIGTHIPYMQGKDYTRLIMPNQHNPIIARWIETSNYTKTLIAKYWAKPRISERNMMTFEHEDNVQSGIIMMGLELISMDTQRIESWLAKGVDQIIGWIPVWTNKWNEHYYCNTTTSSLLIEECNTVRNVNRSLIWAAQTGKPIPVSTQHIHKGVYINVEVMFTTLGMALVNITQRYYDKILYTQASEEFYSPGLTQVKLPWLNITIEQLNKHKELFTVRHLNVDRHLYKAIRYRLMIGKVDFDTALNFARTKASTYTITNLAVDQMPNVNIPIVYDTTVVAYYMHHRIDKKFSLIKTLADISMSQQPWTETMMQIGLQLASVLGTTIGVLQELCTRIAMESLIDVTTIPYTLSNLRGLIQETQVQLDNVNKSIVSYDLRIAQEAGTESASETPPFTDKSDKDGDDTTDTSESDTFDSAQKTEQADKKENLNKEKQVKNINKSNKSDNNTKAFEAKESRVSSPDVNKTKQINSKAEPNGNKLKSDGGSKLSRHKSYDFESSSTESPASEYNNKERKLSKRKKKKKSVKFSNEPTEMVEARGDLNSLRVKEVIEDKIATVNTTNQNNSTCTETGTTVISAKEPMKGIDELIEELNNQEKEVQNKSKPIKVKPDKLTKPKTLIKTTRFCNEKCRDDNPHVFMYWDGKPIEIVEISINSWENEGYKVHLVSKKNFNEWLHYNLSNVDTLMSAQYSDWIRVALLNKYGGIWVDASTFCCGNINSEWDKLRIDGKDILITGYIEQNIVRCESSLIMSTRSNAIINDMEFYIRLCMESKSTLTTIKDRLSDRWGYDLISKITEVLRGFKDYLSNFIVLCAAVNENRYKCHVVDSNEVLWKLTHFNQTDESLISSIKLANVNELQPVKIVKFAKSHRTILSSYNDSTENSLYTCIKEGRRPWAASQYWMPLPVGSRNTSVDNKEARKWLESSVNNKVLLITIGSTGDIKPLMVMYDSLNDAGFNPIIYTHWDHEHLIKPRRMYKFTTSSTECTLEATKILTSINPINMGAGAKYYKKLLDGASDMIYDNINNCVLVIGSHMTPLVETIASKLQVPLMWTLPFPWQSVTSQGRELLSGVNAYFGKLGHHIKDSFLYEITKTWLKENNCDRYITDDTRMSHLSINIYTFDRQMLHESMQLSFSSNWHCLGPCTVHSLLQPMLNSVRASMKPNRNKILLSFGSITNVVTLPTLSKICLAALELGVQVYLILPKNFNQFQLQDISLPVPGTHHNLHIINSFNYAGNLGYFDLMIHHGGSGTSHDVVCQKIPSLIVPIFGDQFIWAESLQLLGVAKSAKFNANQIDYKSAIEECITNLTSMNIKLKQLPISNGFDKHKFLSLVHDTTNILPVSISKNLNKYVPKYEILERMRYIGLDNPLSSEEVATPVYWEIALDTDPNGLYCVMKSLDWFFNNNFEEEIRDLAIPQFFDLLKPVVNYTELKDGITGLGLNLVILINNECRFYNVNDTGNYIALLIEQTETAYHVSPLKFLNYEDRRPVRFPRLNNQIERSILDYTNGLTTLMVSDRYLPITSVEECFKNLSEFEQNNINARIKNRKELLIWRRGNVTHKWVGTQPSSQNISCHLHDRPISYTTLSICSITGINRKKKRETKLSLILDYDDMTIILQPISGANSMLITRLGLTIYRDPMKRLIEVNQETTVLAIDHLTIKQCNLHPGKGITNKLVTPSSTNYILLIYEYDNRKHHCTDNQSFIQNSKEVRWLGEEPTIDEITELDSSRNRAVSRIIYKVGKICYITDCHRETLSIWIEALLHYNNREYTKELTSIITKDPIGDEIEHIISCYTRVVAGSLKGISEDEITSNNRSKISKIELMRITPGSIEAAIDYGWLNEEEHYYLHDEYVILDRNEFKMKTSHPNLLWVRCDGRRGVYIADIDAVVMTMVTGQGPDWLKMKNIPITTGQLAMEEWKEPHSWRNISVVQEFDPQFKGSVAGDPFLIEQTLLKKKTEKPKLNEEQLTRLNDGISFMSYLTETSVASINTDTYIQVLPEFTTDFYMHPYIAPFTDNYTGCNWEPLYEIPDLNSIHLWEDRDLSDWLTMYAPINPMTIKSRELPSKLIEVEKLTMTKYPTKARPVLTKVVYEESRSIAGRLGSVAHIRNVPDTPNASDVIQDMCIAYFNSNYLNLIAQFQDDKIIFEAEDIQAWIEECKDAPKVLLETIKLLSEELISKPISAVNIHLKLESLLKAEPITSMRAQQARIIVWHRKAVCALYAPIFKKAKDRLKMLLSDKVIYTDGLTPEEISNRSRTTTEAHVFFENDLTKQDRQTDDPIINVEMIIYKLLGVHDCVIASWHEMHKDWMFNGNFNRGYGHSMRLTGQATTALGNAITNMQVHAKFFREHKTITRLILLLGDDMLAVMSRLPNYKHLKKEISTKFNMQSKETINQYHGSFCNMIAYRLLDGRMEVGPDIVRLKYRYEVTSGVSDKDPVKMFARAISYIYMIGMTREVEEIIKVNNLKIKPRMWYSFHDMMVGCSDKYDLSLDVISGLYINLLKMICEQTVYSYKFLHFAPTK